jgi:MFS family permease
MSRIAPPAAAANRLLAPGPRGVLGAATLIETLGTGINYALLPFFLIRAVGLTAAQVGAIMSVAGIAALVSGFALGHVADLVGPRWVVVAAYTGQAVAAASLPFVRGVLWVGALLCLAVFAKEGGRAVRYTVIARVGEDDPVRFRAQIQVVSNLGVAGGAAAGGIAAQVGTRPAYTVTLLACAACFLGAAALQAALPPMPPIPLARTDRPGRAGVLPVLRDRPYLAVTGIHMLLSLQIQVLTLAIPLWIITRHAAPAWTVSALLLLNTGVVAVYQVRAAAGVVTPVDAGYRWRRAGFAFLGSCLIVPVTRWSGGWVAIALILLAVAVHTLGETWHGAGMFQLALGLAPAHAMGKYQGVFNFGEGAATAFGPLLVTLLCIAWGAPGWLVLGAVLLATGLGAPPVTRWAQGNRPAY